MPAERVAAVREAVEKSGGVLELDASGQPVAIDLATGRGSADKSAIDAALACSALKRLRINAGELRVDEVARIVELASLEELSLENAPVGDEFLKTIAARLTKLTRLTLRNTPQVTSQGIASLGRMGLVSLGLLEVLLDPAAIEALAAMPTLTSLDLRMSSPVGAEQVAPLAALANLRELKLGGFTIDDAAVAALGSARLQSLTIEDASIGPEGLAALAAGPEISERLGELALARCAGVTDEALKPVAQLPRLRRLLLRDLPITGEFLVGLPSAEALETLALNQVFLSDEAFEAIARCRNLRHLQLALNPLSLAAIERIASLEKLEQLNLSECGLSDDMLEPLKRLNNLKRLITAGNPELSEAAVAEVAPGRVPL